MEVRGEADLVRRMLDLYLCTESLRAVASQLNAEGIRTRRGKPWHVQAIKGVLGDPLYVGANVYGRRASGDTRLKPREEWVVVPGMREPMIDAETFEAAQRLLGSGQPKKLPSPPGHSLLTGLVRCGKCKSPMFAYASRRAGGKAHRYYRCNGNCR